MSIRLDWDIETDHSSYRAEDDPRQRQARRRARLVVLAGALLIAALIGGLVAAARERLRQLDRAEEQILIDTATAEIAALRIGDRAAYLGFFRSADDSWIADQQAAFDSYQDLKREGQIELIGQVEAVEIDGQRGRLQVTEVLGGVPYTRVQFYWDYPDDSGDDAVDGWRRVPPDYSFWGAPALLEGQHVTLAYHTVDAALAESASVLLDDWLVTGCAALNCPVIPGAARGNQPGAGRLPALERQRPLAAADSVTLY
ncbi:hypothetical protein HC928_13735 [bacterium]|nr:hypothetical protein [bacterium]